MGRDRRLLAAAVLAALTILVPAAATIDGRRWEAGWRWEPGGPVEVGLFRPRAIAAAPAFETVGRRWI